MDDLVDVFGDDGFDSGAYEPSVDQFAPLPAGWYTVEIEKTEVKKTQAGTGSYLKLQLSVVGDQFGNRKLFKNVTLQNPHPKAVEIGLRDLAAIGQAVGIARITSSEQLLGGTMDVRVIIEKEPNQSGEYDNDVKAFAAAGTGGAKTNAAPAARPTSPPARPAATVAAGTPSVASAPAAAGKRPWER